MLSTALKPKRRKQVKSEPLYNTNIKGLPLKSLSLQPKQQKAFTQ